MSGAVDVKSSNPPELKQSSNNHPKLTERELFNYEAKRVAKLDYRDVASTLGTISENVRTSLKSINIIKSSEGLSTGSVSNEKLNALLGVAALRKLNRLNHLKCAQAKEETNEQRAKIDEYHLRLQNMLYEIGHLQKEIDRCLQFRSKDEELDLVAVEDFYSCAPETISRPEVTRADEHEQRKARIEWELEQRKCLADELSQARTKINCAQSDIHDREQKLESLNPQLSSILETTRPVQEYLGLNYTTQKEQYKLASLLPSPLYILYRNFDALSKTISGVKVTVNIEGDVDAARSLKATQQRADDEDDDSDQEADADTEEKQKSGHRKRMTTSQEGDLEAKTLKTHPLSVVLILDLPGTDCVCLTLNFAFLSYLETVTVRAVLTETLSTESLCSGDLLSMRSILSCLYPEDKGDKMPLLSASTKLQALGEKNLRRFDVGIPFVWAQSAAGIGCLSDGPDDSGNTNAAALVRRINVVVQNRVALLKLLVELEKTSLNVPDIMRAQLPTRPPTSRLHKWTRVTYEDFAIPNRDLPLVKLGLVSPDFTFFVAEISCLKMKVDAFVILSPTYPEQAAIVSLKLFQGSHRANSLKSEHIRAVEQAVNSMTCQGIPKPEKAQIVCAQIYYLLWCIDVYQAIQFLNTPQDGSVPVKLMPTAHRGRDRSLPLKYNPTTGYFTH